MSVPLQIAFHNVPHSDAIEDDIRQRVAKLESIYKRMTACRVVVEAPARAAQKGTMYDVRIDIDVPGSEIVVSREPHPDCHQALNEAFAAAKRQLLDHSEKQKRS
ncbi:MAG: HPF/RaiA family ribosome-associated protein [Geminicoccaceae bacterium]